MDKENKENNNMYPSFEVEEHYIYPKNGQHVASPKYKNSFNNDEEYHIVGRVTPNKTKLANPSIHNSTSNLCPFDLNEQIVLSGGKNIEYFYDGRRSSGNMNHIYSKKTERDFNDICRK